MAQHSSRNQPLDILRGIAILLVLGYHYNYIAIWSRIGWIGVDLFFVLSGFLVSGLLFSEYKRFGNIDAVRFLVRRGFKIYPAFYTLMVFSVADSLVTQGSVPRTIWGEVFFLQNYWTHMWPHTWSLAVEEHFYWMLPLLLLLMIRKSSDKKNPFSSIPWTFVALGYYRHYRPELFARMARRPLWIPALLLLLPAFVFPLGNPIMDTIGFTCLYAGFSCLVVWAVDRRSSRGLTARSLAWTGRYSYSIYLWHFVIGFLVFNGAPNFPMFLLYVATAVGAGAGMSALIEVPHLKLRDRWFPSRSSQRVAAVAAERAASLQNLATSG